MAQPSVVVDWGRVWFSSKDGQLMELLAKLPRVHWTERDSSGWSLLHFACLGDNAAAACALLCHGLDVNSRDALLCSVAHSASHHGQTHVLELLCAAGADLQARTVAQSTPLQYALNNLPLAAGSACVLVANGVRLASATGHFADLVTPELRAFERGVLRCRAAVVAMLRVKRASGKLVRWDKFLLHLMAVCVWSTRSAREWQN